MAFLRQKGIDCYAASVSPQGSAWDRACELYAQISGGLVDYGLAHSKRFRHARYGADFTGRPLIDSWDNDTRLVLIGHSFGGATIRLFSELLANGDAEERKATKEADLSDFFKGGMADRIFSMVTLASPMNGTTAYDLYEDPDFDMKKVRVPLWSRLFAIMMTKGNRIRQDGRDPKDYANYDMHIDNAFRMNERITTLPHVYYFSAPCSHTKQCPDGTYRPKKKMEPLFHRHSCLMGSYTGKTRGGIFIDELWLENDGLVNTISAMAPSGAASKSLDRARLEPGMWNVFPTLEGDHMWVQGGLFRRHHINDFYLDLIGVIESIER